MRSLCHASLVALLVLGAPLAQAANTPAPAPTAQMKVLKPVPGKAARPTKPAPKHTPPPPLTPAEKTAIATALKKEAKDAKPAPANTAPVVVGPQQMMSGDVGFEIDGAQYVTPAEAYFAPKCAEATGCAAKIAFKAAPSVLYVIDCRVADVTSASVQIEELSSGNTVTDTISVQNGHLVVPYFASANPGGAWVSLDMSSGGLVFSCEVSQQ
jgi:hypothetical protein